MIMRLPRLLCSTQDSRISLSLARRSGHVAHITFISIIVWKVGLCVAFISERYLDVDYIDAHRF